jgi:hypothetical protein
MLINFNDYKNKTLLESIRKLKLIKKVLKLASLSSKLFIKGEDSYIYLKSTNKDSDIGGIIIYPIANKIAFRIQNTPDSLPQGKPVLLDFEKVFNDIYNDYERNKSKKDSDLVAAKKVVDDFVETIKEYFKTESFEKKEKEKVLGLTLGTDYASMVYSKY